MKRTARAIATATYTLLYINTVYTAENTEFVIITASYNNEAWCRRNIESIFNQNYSHWHLIYINDCSTDRTATMVLDLVDQYNVGHKVTLINNTERKGHLCNQYHAIHTCDDHKVIVIVDGDDWLNGHDVLSYLNGVYSREDIWMTYGQFWYWKKNKLGCSRSIPKDIIENNAIRDYPLWITSHLRTFYAGLYKKIRLESLLCQNVFFPMSADVATMLPMIEMAGKHSLFIAKILYIYNDNNTLNFYHDHEAEQRTIRAYIRALERYQPLDTI